MTRALITGGDSGIGFELAKLFASDGIDLILVSEDENNLKRQSAYLENNYRIHVIAISMNLAVRESAERLIERVHDEDVSFLVNNAGFGVCGSFCETDASDELALLELAIMTTTTLTKHFVRKMLQKKHGRILNVSSTAAFQPCPRFSVYAASKAYILSFSEALSHELRSTGVSVTVLCPGPTRTHFSARSRMETTRLFEAFLVMEAYHVALAGYRGLQARKRVIIPGFFNLFVATILRFTPKWIAMSNVEWLLATRTKS